jgi:putative ABC transport system permease protein
MLKNYLKVALKVLGRRKFYTFISLFGISVTLVVLMVATALLDHIFAPQAPETRGDRTLGIYQIGLRGEQSAYTGFAGYGLAERAVGGLPQETPAVQEVSIFSTPGTVVSYVDGKKIESMLKHTDGAFWRILDFEFLEGGPFTAEDDKEGRFVAVINETTRRRFFGDQTALGRTIRADDQSFRVVGVVRDVPILRVIPFADVWTPNGTAKSTSYRTEYMGFYMAAILARSRADFPAIKAEVASRLKEAEAHIPDRRTFQRIGGGADTLFEAVARVIFGGRTLEGGQSEKLFALLSLLGVMFMVLPTVNLVNINLSRILDRASEIGVRKAFGASSRTLVGQFIVENLVLTLLGGLLGLVLAAGVLAALNASGVIPYAQLHLNLRVFAYGLAIALFFGLFSGVYPAWRMSRVHPVQALRGRSV